jgi:hypothetical protein
MGPARERPATLTAPPDGTTLEGVIGELQSKWGVPQNPQEFRITLRVAEDSRGTPAVAEEREEPSEGRVPGEEDARPKREKAPAAPRIGASGQERPGRRRRRRGRRRKG